MYEERNLNVQIDMTLSTMSMPPTIPLVFTILAWTLRLSITLLEDILDELMKCIKELMVEMSKLRSGK